jgi:hypothetical protein
MIPPARALNGKAPSLMIIKTTIIAMLTLAVLTTTVFAADRAEKRNLQIMLRAAQSLQLPKHNEAVVLSEESPSGVSKFGIIFGYDDNAAACREIAATLSALRLMKIHSTKFRCNAIH